MDKCKLYFAIVSVEIKYLSQVGRDCPHRCLYYFAHYKAFKRLDRQAALSEHFECHQRMCQQIDLIKMKCVLQTEPVENSTSSDLAANEEEASVAPMAPVNDSVTLSHVPTNQITETVLESQPKVESEPSVDESCANKEDESEEQVCANTPTKSGSY